jgi:hypothetical protein
MTNVHDEMTTATSNSPSRWAVWVAYGACGWAFLVFGGFVALALIRPWGSRVSRWVLFLIAAWIYARRSPHWRVDLVFGALGVLGALVLLVLSGGTIG